MKRIQAITILGSTGSIGVSTLDVVARHPDRFEVHALTGHSRIDVLAAQCIRHRPRHAVVGDEGAASVLRTRLFAARVGTAVHAGPQALIDVATAPEVDGVMAAIVGAAGLPPTLAAANAGKRVLLANKESLVMAGAVFMRAVDTAGATLLPIDSEHNAVFQSMPGNGTGRGGVRRILLTASGGPFRETPVDALANVSVEQAVAHPKWSMGRKISVDSATMMNKGLEVIEARWLFELPPERIRVIVHPQSVIHSMVQYVDASVVAQLGTPDMRVPIAYGLAWPERVASGAATLDFTNLGAMTFESFDGHGHRQRFPGLQLAWDALAGPPGTPAVLNAANEVGVEAFLDRRIRFDQIHAVNLATLEAVATSNPRSLQDLLDLDARSRAAATAAIGRLGA